MHVYTEEQRTSLLCQLKCIYIMISFLLLMTAAAVVGCIFAFKSELDDSTLVNVLLRCIIMLGTLYFLMATLVMIHVARDIQKQLRTITPPPS